MTTPGLNAIGYCVNYSQQGEWAFSLALEIARRHSLQLNVFHFVSDPYKTGGIDHSPFENENGEQTLIEMEKKMRLHYDDRLGDYLDVGFRLCEENEWTELHRCLCKHEFQLLVLALPSKEAAFGSRRLIDFADGFVCPVVLVGPDAETEITLNEPARLIAYRVGLDRISRNSLSLAPQLRL